MSAPPVPPRPYESTNHNLNPNPGAPPPLPPLPPDLRLQTERYNTPSPYENQIESPPRFENPMIAPRPHRVDPSIPADMARKLDEQVYRQQSLTRAHAHQHQLQLQQHQQSLSLPPAPQTPINYAPGFVMPGAAPPQIQIQQQQPPPNWTPWSAQNQNQNQIGATYTAPPVDLSTSLANLSMASYASPVQQQQQLPPQPQPQPPLQQPQQLAYSLQPALAPALALAPLPAPPVTAAPPTSTAPAALPPLTAPLPQLAQLQAAASQIQSPTHDPSLKIAWCRDVFFLVDRAGPHANGVANPDPPVGPVQIADPVLAELAQVAVPLVLQLAGSWSSGQGGGGGGGQGQGQPKMPPYISEAISIRATLAATGAFPSLVPHNPRTAFRDFEAAARGGHAAAWFRLGRDYENFNDFGHARECFERGAKAGVEGCLYRLGMAHLLGQLSLPPSPPLALPLLHRAALLASLPTPQPAYVYALLLLSEFTLLSSSSPSLQPIPPSAFSPYIPPNSAPALEARKHLERAAYLHFGPAQYKLGHAYEFAEPPFVFDPLMSVRYYSLASEGGEVEADMALSKWFLCGSGGAALAGQQAQGDGAPGGGFEKDEGLALVFAARAARKGLPSAEFAMGYYAEVGVGQVRDVGKAVEWYQKAAAHANPDAPARLLALTAPTPSLLTRSEHDQLTEAKLGRRRTQAMRRAEEEPLSPPWEGRVFPSAVVWEEGAGAGGVGPVSAGGRQGQAGGAGGAGGQPQPQPQGAGPGRGQGQGRRRQDGRMVVDVIRKNSLAAGYAPSPASAPATGGGRMPVLREQTYDQNQNQPSGYSNVQQNQGQGQYQPQRTQSPGVGGGGGTNQRRRNESPSGRVTPQGGRSASPGVHGAGSSPGRPGAGEGNGRSKLERMRLNLVDDPAPSNSNSYSNANASANATTNANANAGKVQAATFAELGINSGAVGGKGRLAAFGFGSGSNSNSNSSSSANLNAITNSNSTVDTPIPALSTPGPGPSGGAGGPGGGGPTTARPTSGNRPQTFAEMGIHGAKAEEKDCVVM